MPAYSLLILTICIIRIFRFHAVIDDKEIPRAEIEKIPVEILQFTIHGIRNLPWILVIIIRG